ncbi:asparaginase [Actinomyces israelii]|uniref:asparaginase n=1 Tax=Actinomyces israelii TaxID=1659 RepID=UPI0005B83301|nr:asparaginase [Actinomyces israelii]
MPIAPAPSVHIIYAGGTIGMVDSPDGLVPGADLGHWLAALLKGTDLEGRVSLAALDPLIDSANATPESWQAILNELRAHRVAGPTAGTAAGTEGTASAAGTETAESAQSPGGANAYVVLHGTDTMAYTSAALSYALTGFDRPVVVTGAQLPLGAVGSDAAPNVAGALRAATSGRATGVALFFGHHLLAGNRATKTSTWGLEGFASPCAAPLATAGAPWQWAPAPDAEWGQWDQRPAACTPGANRPRPLPYGHHDVVVVDLVPGITASRLRALLTPLPDAVILRAFGVGNVPSAQPGLTDVVADAVEAGTAVVVASQCHQAEVVLGRYETGDAIARAGAVGSGDMTLEATYAKVQFLLAQGLRGGELAARVGRSIAGELTEPHG